MNLIDDLNRIRTNGFCTSDFAVLDDVEEAFREAHKEATSGKYVDRALRCAEVLERVLDG